jgi:hypothetical protein
MERGSACVGIVSLLILVGCGSLSGPEGNWQSGTIAHDFTTPEGAVLSLDDAYRAGDIDAAVKCKDFTLEAQMILKKLETDLSGDVQVVAETAETLELAYRAELKQKGFPTHPDAVKTTRMKYPVKGRDDLYDVTERFWHKGGTATVNKLLVAKTADGWKVITPLE